MTDNAGALLTSARQTLRLPAPPGSTRGRALLLCLALLAGALASPPALADARGDAKKHYRDGMAAIAAGQYERGIEELKQAYTIKPHPDVLYNIARAYVDLGNIPEALRYFRQYVATDPDDRASVEAVMTRLQAAIAQPAGEKRPAAPQPQGEAQTDSQKLMAQLAAMLAKAQGQQPAEERQAGPAALPAAPAEEEMFAATEITAATKATAKEIAAGLSAERGGEDLFEEQVVTAGVRASAESKAPASLTVITEEDIRLSGASSIPDVLRMVPGIDVAEMNPSDVNLSIRGFNRRVSNKVLVLVDGRSVFQDFLGATMWALIDVAIVDIARIEVIRGPGSALYGSNAFAGVINIITKTGDDASGARAWVMGGNHNTVLGGVSSGGKSGKLSYRTTVGYDRADKWTREFDPTVSSVYQFSQPNRSHEVERATASATYDAGKFQLNTGGGFDNFATELFPLGALRSFFTEGQSGYARAEVIAGQTRVRAFWNALRMKAGPEEATLGLADLKGSVRSDVIDVTAQSGFDFKLGGSHHFNYGGGWRMKSVDWTYLAVADDGTHRYTEHHFNLFLQEEWQIGRSVSLVLSYRIDRHPLLAQYSITPGGIVQSPRGSLIWEVRPEQVIRFTVGTAFRVPTFLESYIDLLAPVPDQPAVSVRFRGDQKLSPEQILQAELGYRGRIGVNFQPEVVLYAERVSSLISDGALTKPPAGGNFDPGSDQYIIGFTGFNQDPNTYLGLGAELGFKWTPTEGVDIKANYSLEKMANCSGSCSFETSGNSETAAVLGNTASSKVNAMITWRTRAGIDLGADVHFVSGVNWVEKSFNPNATGGVDFISYPLDAYTLINGRIGYRAFKDKLDLGLAVHNLLGDNHREHPFGNQIGRRVTFTASGSF
jgi:outer membrane receptor protein involved in Fe transport